MKRLLTSTCLAATFAVGLAAQSTGTAGTAGTPQDPQAAAGGQRGGGPRTATGCLRAGDAAGSFTLTDVVMQGGRAGSGGGTGTTAGGTGTGAAASGTATGAPAGATAGSQATPPMTINLTPDASVDLKAHVGHKVEVTGTLAGGRGRSGAGAGSTGTATGTTAGTGTTGGTATATGTGTTSGTGTAGTAQGGGRGPRNMTVTSVRMISESCS